MQMIGFGNGTAKEILILKFHFTNHTLLGPQLSLKKHFKDIGQRVEKFLHIRIQLMTNTCSFNSRLERDMVLTSAIQSNLTLKLEVSKDKSEES